MKDLIDYAKRHSHLWRHQGDHYWLARLHQEVAELTLTLDHQHQGPRNHELLQIATICINWLHKEHALQYPEEDTC